MEKIRWEGVVIGVGLIGMGLLAYGLWEQIKPGEVRVEVIRDDQKSEVKHGYIVVNVSGAVQHPGSYKLQARSRIGDALVAANGLLASADREWVAKNIDLEKEIKDGEKVYIPEIGRKQEGEKEKQVKLINVNTASEGELDSLEGIGKARAKAIIENRPYRTVEELVSKAKIPTSVYEKIKSSIRVY